MACGVCVAELVAEELGVCVAVPVTLLVPDALKVDETDGVAAPLGLRDSDAPTDCDGVSGALGVELALVVVDDVACGVCVAELVAEELGVCVAVPVALLVPDALTVDETDGVAAPLGLCEGDTPKDKLGVGAADTVDVAVGEAVAARLLVELGVLVALDVPLPELVGGRCARLRGWSSPPLMRRPLSRRCVSKTAATTRLTLLASCGSSQLLECLQTHRSRTGTWRTA